MKLLSHTRHFFTFIVAFVVLFTQTAGSLHAGSGDAFADNCSNCFDDIVARLIGVISLGIPILFALSVLVTLFGATLLIANAGSEDKRQQGRTILIWGIIFIVVSSGLWSIVLIIRQTFGLL